MFVVIGMSFECATDRGLLSILHAVEDDVPLGSAWWLVINRDQQSAESSAGRIATTLPRARVTYVAVPFEEWISNGMPELVAARILRAADAS